MGFDLEKMRSVVVGSRRRTRDRVVEGRDEAGYRTRAVTDQLGNTVTEHASPDDRVDVCIKAPHIRVGGAVREIRENGYDNA